MIKLMIIGITVTSKTTDFENFHFKMISDIFEISNPSLNLVEFPLVVNVVSLCCLTYTPWEPMFLHGPPADDFVCCC